MLVPHPEFPRISDTAAQRIQTSPMCDDLSSNKQNQKGVSPMANNTIKRFLAFILITCMIISSNVLTAAGQEALSQTYTQYAYIIATLNKRLATRTGPGTQYDEPGSFLSAGQTVFVLSKAYDQRNEIWWVQVEFSAGGNSYRAYTGTKRFSDLDLNDLPEEYIRGTCYIPFASITGYYGPSDSYKKISRKIPGQRDVDIIALAYDSDRVFFQIEFYDSGINCWRRAWVDENDVSRNYYYEGVPSW